MTRFITGLLLLSSVFAFGTNHQVAVINFGFTPAALTISVGDTVTWTNNSGGGHNINGTTATFANNPASFGNGAPSASAWSYSFTFTTAGAYSYHCDPHAPAMAGTIMVVAAAMPCADLFFSEYLEGTSNNKALEIYNPTNAPINMLGYAIKVYSNGGVTAGNTLNFPNKTIPAHGVYVIANAGADTTILNRADTTSTVTFFNGDDAVVLFKNTDTLDIIGVVGVDPGTFWSVGAGSTLDKTLVRKNTVQMGQRNWTIGATEWDVFPVNTATNLDAHTSICAGAMPALPCSELFFSEYIEGSGNNKALEIYNPSNMAINLTGYKIAYFNNGASTASSTFPLYGSLASGATFVLCADQSNAAILAKADTALAYPSVVHYNGDDAVILLSPTNDTIDAIGVVGIDPGSSWPVGTGATANNTLVRKTTIDAGTKDWAIGATQWDVYPQDTTMYLGAHTSNCLMTMPTGLPTYSINQINNVDANGVLDSLNVTCYIKGIVSGGNLRTSGVEFWLIDTINSTGALIRNTAFVGYTVAQGDKIRVRGTVNQFNGLMQFVPDSIWVLSTANVLPAAASITTLNEASEGRLVTMSNLTYVSGWPVPGANANVLFTDGTVTYTIRFLSGAFIPDSMATAPTGMVNIKGHGSQFDNSSPFTTGYQLQPRRASDISAVVIASPTVNFASGAQTVAEGAGMVTINLPVVPTASSAQTVKVYVSNGAGVTSGDYTTTPAAVNDTITLSVASGASASFMVNVIDDIVTENPETITFTIAKTSIGLLTGPVAMHMFTIADNDFTIPTYSISQLKGLNPVTILPDSLGVYLKTVGTVLGVNMQSAASGSVSITIHNGTHGIGVFMPASNYTVQEGDQVRVIGTMAHFNGLGQINADSIVFISANNPLPTAMVITAMDETTESQLIRFNNATLITPSQWTNTGSGFNVDLTDGTNVITIRIDADVDLYTQPAPTGTFDVIGIGGQFDNSAPHNSGYQFLPRYTADIILPTPVSYDLSITEIMSGSNDPNAASNSDWWELTNHGTTAINLDGFSWDDDSEIPGTVTFPNITIGAGESFVIYRGLASEEPAFDSIWGLGNKVTILSANEMTGVYPNLSQSGDVVALYDTSAVPVEICKVSFANAMAGISVEFDTNCTVIGNAVNGQRGAYTSLGTDVGSPGNVAPVFGINELSGMRVQLYPNPTSGLVNLELPAGTKTISISNIAGVRLMETTTLEEKYTINISAYPAGVYFISLELNGKKAVKKLVKN